MVTCGECGFRGDERSNGDLVRQAAGFATRYAAPLSRFLPGEDAGALLRARPTPATWSALEYAAHVRDALAFYTDRIRRVVAEDRPRLQAFGFAAACDERRYVDEAPDAVVRGVAAATDDLVTVLAGLPHGAWMREGIGSTGDPRTVRTLAERAVHEGHHHLLDVGRSLRTARGRDHRSTTPPATSPTTPARSSPTSPPTATTGASTSSTT